MYVRLCIGRIILAWLYERGFHSDIIGGKFIICYIALLLFMYYKLMVPKPKDSLPSYPSCYLSYTMDQ